VIIETELLDAQYPDHSKAYRVTAGPTTLNRRLLNSQLDNLIADCATIVSTAE